MKYVSKMSGLPLKNLKCLMLEDGTILKVFKEDNQYLHIIYVNSDNIISNKIDYNATIADWLAECFVFSTIVKIYFNDEKITIEI